MKTCQSSIFARLVTSALLFSLCGGTLLTSRAQGQSDSARMKTPRTAYPSLHRYGTDLTRLARQGRLDAVAGDDAEISRTIEILSRGGAFPVLVSDNNLNTASISRSVAQKIAAGDVPDNLKSRQLFSLSLDRLAERANDRGEFEARLRSVLDETAGSKGHVVLFIDQLHQYIGTNAGPATSNRLRSLLERRNVSVVGATSAAAYANYISADESLAKIFQPVVVGDEPSKTEEQQESSDARKPEGFVGDNVSPDLRQMIASGGSHSNTVNVIVQTSDLNGKLAAQIERQGGRVLGRMPSLNALSVELPISAVEKLAFNKSASFISLDRKIASLGHVETTTGAADIRRQTSSSVLGLVSTSKTLDGTGIGIAVVDSGVDAGHKVFAKSSGSRVVYSQDFTGENRTDDPYGHGTHVAGAAAGVNIVQGWTTYTGIAPNANIINLRVLDSRGMGTTSNLLNALNWILSPVNPNLPLGLTNTTNRQKYNIRVVNLSLGASAVNSYANDPVCRAVRSLVDAGVVVVAAAGNNGKDGNGNKIYGQIHSPGDEPSAITVGAVNTFGTDSRADDGITSYSSRGPTRGYYTDANGINHHDNIIKPDLSAPGNKLIWAESDLSDGSLNLIVTQNPQLDSGLSEDSNRRMMYLSGTSMSAPIVSGAAALLLQANPKLTPNIVKLILMYTAQPLSGFNMLEQGTGELNIKGAVRLAQLVRTDLSSTTAVGAPLLTGPLPNPQDTIA
jgi:subtilisin family serine protease